MVGPKGILSRHECVAPVVRGAPALPWWRCQDLSICKKVKEQGRKKAAAGVGGGWRGPGL